MNTVFLSAIKNSTKLRTRLGLNIFEPLNIYDTCQELGVAVRIVNINMEGMYIKSDKINKPSILLSNLRPFARRAFTCAHELGHHFYEHGSKIDGLNYSSEYTLEQDQEELLVNAFAGYLLMPIAGIQAEFVKRSWKPNTSSSIQFYIISSYFGVGYQTLLYHCRANRIITYSKMQNLLKYSPAKIFSENYVSNLENSHFKVIDKFSQPHSVDIETSNYLILPLDGFEVNTNYLKPIIRIRSSIIYRVIKKGVTEINPKNIKTGFELRIGSKDYVGLSEYRHLE